MSALVKFILLVSAMLASNTFAYQVTLDTSTWSGNQITIAYDLIDGSPDSSRLILGAIAVDGTSLGSAGSIQDHNFYNSLEFQVALGNKLQIDFTLDFGGYTPGYFPDSFAIYLLDAGGLPLFPTSDPSGADSIVQWDIGVVDPITYVGQLIIPPTNSVPEPSSLLLIFAGLVMWKFQLARKLLSPAVLLSSFMFVVSSAVEAAPTLSLSSDIGSQVQMTASGLRLNRQTSTFDSVLTIKNISQLAIETPVTIAVVNLPSGVILTNATAISDEGIPLLSVEGGTAVASGSTVTLVMKFVNRTNQVFSPSIRLVRLTQAIPALATLQGPDLDGNGVRDDLEPLLDNKYQPGPQRNAAIQVLKNIRIGLGATGSVEGAFNAMLGFYQSLDCLYEVYGIDGGAEQSKLLRDAMMNTKDRLVAWLDLANKVAGQSLPVGKTNACVVE